MNAGGAVGLLLVAAAMFCSWLMKREVDNSVRDRKDLFEVQLYFKAMAQGRSVDDVRRDYIGIDHAGELIRDPNLSELDIARRIVGANLLHHLDDIADSFTGVAEEWTQTHPPMHLTAEERARIRGLFADRIGELRLFERYSEPRSAAVIHPKT